MRTMERLVNGNIEVTIPVRLKFDGHKTVLVRPDSASEELDPDDMTVLQKALVQGSKYRDALENGEVETVSELSRRENQDRAFMFRSLSMVNLAPDIVEAILDGTEPAKLTMATLRHGIPDDWNEQRQLFGMA